jgi:acyl carrier protein
MSKAEVLVRVGDILRETFDESALKVSESTSREDVPAWDSLGHIRVLTAVEEAFGVRFDLDEIEGITTAGAIAELVLRKS